MPRPLSIPRPIVLMVALLGAASPLPAATFTWDTTAAPEIQDGSGDWNTADSRWTTDNGGTNTTYANTASDSVIFGAGGAGATVTVTGSVNANAITFNGTTDAGYTVSGGTITLTGTAPTITANNIAFETTVASSLAGTAGLVKNGAGTLNLSGANTYAGATTVNAGTLAVTGAGTLAPSYAGAIAIASGATFAFASSSGQIFDSGTLSGNGAFIKDGAGLLTLYTNSSTANQGYTGNVTVNGGELRTQIYSTANATGIKKTFGTGTITVNNATLGFQTGAVTNTHTYENNIVLNGGTISHMNAHYALTGNITLTGDNYIRGTVASRNLTLSGIISGNGSLTKAATGVTNTLTLSGVNTYTGTTTVNAGTLAVTGTIRVNGVNGITVASGATLALSGTLKITSATDSILANGTLTAGGTLDLGGHFDSYSGSEYALISGSGSKTGSFTVTGYDHATWSSVTFNAGTGSLVFTAVPEPSTCGLSGAGIVAGAAFMRRRRRAVRG